MGLYGIIKFFFRRSLELTILLVLITLIPNLPPKANISEPYKISPTKPFTGGLQLNQKLDDVQIWHKGDLHGPEAFADYNGELYTSVHGGDIVKLTGNHITPIVKIGNPCKFFYEEEICGRPLGMQFDKNGALFVADPYLGVFKINVKTGEKIQLISPDEEIGGKKSKIFNSLVLSSNGDIYWTDSSTQFSLQDGLFDTFADPSGRLIHYDSKTKKNSILIDHLHFANGVALSDNEEFIIVAETGRNKIHRFYLKGPKKGTKDVFIDGLPGLPDNLKSDGKGGFLVPLVVAVDDDHPQMIQIFGEFPFVRKLICRVFGLIELFFKSVNQVYPNEFSKYSIHAIGNFAMASRLFTPARVSILRLSQNGEVLDSIHTVAKKIGGISEAHIFKDTLYLGSPFNDYIGKIALEKIGWQNLAHTVTKREAPPKVTTTTEKPTTTTSKPPTTTTQKPTTTTQKPTTTSKPVTTTTPRPTTTTAKPTTAAPKVTTTAKPPSKPVQQKTTPPPTQTPKKVPTQQKDQSKTTHPGK